MKICLKEGKKLFLKTFLGFFGPNLRSNVSTFLTLNDNRINLNYR